MIAGTLFVLATLVALFLVLCFLAAAVSECRDRGVTATHATVYVSGLVVGAVTTWGLLSLWGVLA